MTKVTLEIFDDVISTINKIKDINDTGVEIEIPDGSPLFENVLNLKLIKKHADKLGIVVHFATMSELGQGVLAMVEEDRTSAVNKNFQDEPQEDEIVVEEDMADEEETIQTHTKILGKRKMVKKTIKPVLIGLGVALLILGIFHFSQTKREATAKIIINSQPLARSLTIKVKAGTPTDPGLKVLAGTNVRDQVELTKEVETTGEKVVGEKAEGKIKIFNKTDSDETLKKGHNVTYSSDGVDYIFTLKEEVDVPAATEDNTDPVNPVTVYGEIETNVIAADVGEKYNIDKNMALSVKSFKKSEMSAVTMADFDGGKSEKIKVVSEDDKKKLIGLLDADTPKEADKKLNGKVVGAQQLVSGSSKNTVVKETLSKEIGEEASKVSLTRIVEVEGLTYLKTELDTLLDNLVKEFVPQGFVLSSKEREVNIEVLGASTNSTLSSTEADLQVTLKTFIVPDISEDSIKDELKGKTVEEAQKVLGSVKNIKTFEFKMSKSWLPLFNKVPTNPEQIKVIIERQ